MKGICRFSAALGLFLLAARPAHATFHLMQIEQMIGGIGGDTTAQAIQLRMRTADQGELEFTKLVAHDAAGGNPVLIVDFDHPVENEAAGARVLIASAGMANYMDLAPDFTMTNLIPASYLAAGSLTFEIDNGTILWRVSWGGAGYTGPNTGAAVNDADGDFGPPYAAPLPSGDHRSLRFMGSAAMMNITNAANYRYSSGMAAYMNNAGLSARPPRTKCLEDFNHDGKVDGIDVLIGLILFNRPMTPGVPPDLDGSGVIDRMDLLQVLIMPGPCPAAD